MHRCLHISEILSLICGEVSRKSWEYDNRNRDLYALARTCRAFHDPALDCLWHKISSIAPLIKCMPSDLWKAKLEKGREKLSFKRLIVPSDLSRLLTYARRVHILKSYEDGLKNTADYLALSSAAGSQILLPNIRELALEFDCDDIAFSCMINLFLGPEIKKISVSLEGSPVIRQPILVNLGIRHSSLTDVMLWGSCHHLVPDISSAVKSWNLLRSLSVPNLTHDALMHVATLPDLHTLELTKLNEDPISQPVEELGCSFFPSLETLNLTTQNVEFCISVIGIMTSSPSLGHIEITSDNATPPPVWARLYHALQTHFDNTSLQGLTLIDEIGYLEPEDEPGLIEAHQVMPLLSFPNLVDVNLTPAGGIDLDDTLVKKMAKAWRSIQTLTIDDRCVEHLPEPELTLSGLLPLAKFCPKLLALAICFNGTFNQFTTKRPNRSICNKTLTDFNVLSSPVGSQSDLCSLAYTASFLFDIFPNLGPIFAHDGTSTKAWEDISELIQAFAGIRELERASSTDNSDEDDN